MHIKEEVGRIPRTVQHFSGSVKLYTFPRLEFGRETASEGVKLDALILQPLRSGRVTAAPVVMPPTRSGLVPPPPCRPAAPELRLPEDGPDEPGQQPPDLGQGQWDRRGEPPLWERAGRLGRPGRLQKGVGEQGERDVPASRPVPGAAPRNRPGRPPAWPARTRTRSPSGIRRRGPAPRSASRGGSGRSNRPAPRGSAIDRLTSSPLAASPSDWKVNSTKAQS